VIPMSVVAIYIALADTVLYPAYAAAPRIWGISPMLDQHIGGLIMWIPGGLFFYGIMSVVFFKWVKRGEDSTGAAQIGWATGLVKRASCQCCEGEERGVPTARVLASAVCSRSARRGYLAQPSPT